MDLLSSVIGMLTNASSNTKMTISKDEVAELLKTTPEALDAFEKAYTEASAREFKESDNFFDVNSRQAVSDLLKNTKNTSEKVELLTSEIVDELLDQTNIKRITDKNYVSNDDLKTFPENIRPLPAEKEGQEYWYTPAFTTGIWADRIRKNMLEIEETTCETIQN